MNTQMIIDLVLAIFASSGLWTFILYLIQRRNDKKDNLTKLVLGLAYKDISELCSKYIERGNITKDEYEDLVKYLYKPYDALGGDGTAERMIKEVEKLPIVA